MLARGVFQRWWCWGRSYTSALLVKDHLPDLKVRQNEVVRFRKKCVPTSLSRALILPNLPGHSQKKNSPLKGKKTPLTSFTFLCISTDRDSVRNLVPRKLICFRFDRRDVVTTRSVCGHLCHHQWHRAEGLVGNVVFSHPRQPAVFRGDDMMPLDCKGGFKRS